MTATVPVWVTIAVTLAGSLGSFLLGRFTMSKKERSDVRQKNYENSVKATEDHSAAYLAYTNALNAYAADPDKRTFLALCQAGDVYFRQIGRMADAILSGVANEGIRDSTWLPAIRTVVERTLPSHYDTLQREAAKRGYSYSGKLRRRDHASIFEVAERFSQTDAWLRPHEDD